MKNEKKNEIIVKIVCILLLILLLFPFIWLISSSFKIEKDIIAYPPRIFADSYTLDNYKKVFERIPILSYTKNTVIFSFGVMIVSVITDSMAGYALARMHFKGRNVIFICIIVTMMIPYQLLMISLFVEMHFMNLLNKYIGLILPRATDAFGIYLMRQFFITLPKDLEEAARIDGMNEFKIFGQIMIPLCKSAIVSLGILTLMANWNDLFYPLLLTSSTEMRTLPSGIALFFGERVSEFGPGIAGTVFSMAPILILYFFAQRYFTAGIASSGMKE